MKKHTVRDVHYHNQPTVENLIIKVIYDSKDQNKLVVHLNYDLEAYLSEDDEDDWQDFDDFCSDDDDDDDIPSFRLHLLQIRGIQTVFFEEYSISIIKGEVFEWKKLLVQIKTNLELDLNDGNPSEYVEVYSGERRTLVQRLKDFVMPRIQGSVVGSSTRVLG